MEEYSLAAKIYSHVLPSDQESESHRNMREPPSPESLMVFLKSKSLKPVRGQNTLPT